MVLLVLQLVASYGNLFRVDHDEVIAGIAVRGVDRLVFAAQAMRELAGETAERLVRGVDDVPVALDGLRIGADGFHLRAPKSVEGSKKADDYSRQCRLFASPPAFQPVQAGGTRGTRPYRKYAAGRENLVFPA